MPINTQEKKAFSLYVPPLVPFAYMAFQPHPAAAPPPAHLADSDDSLLGDFVSEDVKHVHAVSADNSEVHLRVLPNVSVGGLDSPDWSARPGGFWNSELVNAWKEERRETV